MKNLGQMMKQAQEVQTKMQEMQEKLVEIKITGSSGAGMVTVTLNGKAEMISLHIDPSLFNSSDSEIVEDLIVAAFSDAKAKVEERVSKEMSQITGGLNLPPGFNLPI
ncbi:MAG: YbaB/EbfC family nucleoid-associated protein [Rhodospirillaceae bacterium]|nr:YbaB/EbfC family nucleoid-associated protein [Rhodospirillaceae bacterium]